MSNHISKTAQIIPFGKYKGQPVEQLQHDPAYAEWLIQQPWFGEKYANIQMLIVNNFKEAADSPEHNALQARFLDRQFAYSVVCAFGAAVPFDRWFASEVQPKLDLPRSEYTDDQYGFYVTFEVRGWDVVVDWEFWGEGVAYKESEKRVRYTWKEVLCEFGGRERNGFDNTGCRNSHVTTPGGVMCTTEHSSADFVGPGEPSRYDWCSNIYSIKGKVFRCELKPTMGEDFPSVLRQVKARGESGYVLVERFTAQSVPFESVQKMFASSGVGLLRTSDVEMLKVPLWIEAA